MIPHKFRFGPDEKRQSKLLHFNKVFLDRRSRVVRDIEGKIHLKMAGIDKSLRRTEVYEFSLGLCAVCGKFAPLEGAPGFCGEMHHVSNCDCMFHGKEANLEWRCGQLASDCHRHRRTGFINSAKEQAKKEFESIYREETKE